MKANTFHLPFSLSLWIDYSIHISPPPPPPRRRHMKLQKFRNDFSGGRRTVYKTSCWDVYLQFSLFQHDSIPIPFQSRLLSSAGIIFDADGNKFKLIYARLLLHIGKYHIPNSTWGNINKLINCSGKLK